MACKIIFEARSEYPKCPKCGSPCNVIIDNTRITETHQCWSCDYHRTNDHVQNKSINNNPFYKYNIFIRFIHWLFDDYFINKCFNQERDRPAEEAGLSSKHNSLIMFTISALKELGYDIDDFSNQKDGIGYRISWEKA